MKFPLGLAAAAAGAAIIASFLGTAVDAVNRTVYTFSLTVPASANNRVLVIESNISGATALATTSATWNGIALNKRFEASRSASQWVQTDYWTLPLAPMGAPVTANVVVTCSNTQARAGIASYVLENCQSEIPVVTGSDVVGNPVQSFALAGVPLGGMVLAAAQQISGAARTWTWTAPLVENYDEDVAVGSNVGNHAGANYPVISSGTVTVTATMNSAANLNFLASGVAMR